MFPTAEIFLNRATYQKPLVKTVYSCVKPPKRKLRFFVFFFLKGGGGGEGGGGEGGKGEIIGSNFQWERREELVVTNRV